METFSFTELKETAHSPYLFTLKNTTNKRKKAIVFGYNKYHDSPNYGSEPGVIITYGYSDTQYKHALIESVQEKHIINEILLISERKNQLFLPFLIKSQDARGSSMCKTLFADKRQKKHTKDRIFVSAPSYINGRTHIEFTLMARTEMTVAVFIKD